MLFPDLDDFHSIFTMSDLRYSHQLTDILQMHYLEIPKLQIDKKPGQRTPLERWLRFFKFSPAYEQGVEPLPPDLMEEEGIAMALDAMRRAYASDEVNLMIESRLKAQRD